MDAPAGGVVLSDIAIPTTEGPRVADVAWLSDARFAPHADADSLPIAPEICVRIKSPEICVEIKSPSSSTAEMAIKVAACLEAGAAEVWVVTLDGAGRVHRAGE